MIAVSRALKHDIVETDDRFGCPTRVEHTPDNIEEDGGQAGGIHGAQAYRRLSLPPLAVVSGENASMASRALTSVLSLIVGGSLLVAATGCAPERPPISGPSSGASTSSTPSSTPTGDDPDASASPITASCTDLVNDQTIYDWGSGNYAADPNYAPAADSAAAEIVAHQGLACGWINLSSGEKLAVAVANLSSSAIDEKRSALDADSTAVTDFGDSGWFRVDGAVGIADVIRGNYWIVASSTYFSVPTDATPIVDVATAIAG